MRQRQPAPAPPDSAVFPIGVGIDISRYGHHATFLRPDLQPAAADLDFAESAKGYAALRQPLDAQDGQFGPRIAYHEPAVATDPVLLAEEHEERDRFERALDEHGESARWLWDELSSGTTTGALAQKLGISPTQARRLRHTFLMHLKRRLQETCGAGPAP